MEQAVQDKLDRFGANILITPRTEQLTLGFGDVSRGGPQVAHSRLTAADEKAIRGIEMKERLRSVVPFFLAAADASGKNIVWMGIPAMEIAAARPWWKISGSPIREKGEILLGSEAAAALDKGPGGTVVSGGRTFRVTGVLHPTGEKEDGMVIAALGDVQSLGRNPGGVTFFEVAALCKDCPVEDIGGRGRGRCCAGVWGGGPGKGIGALGPDSPGAGGRGAPADESHTQFVITREN